MSELLYERCVAVGALSEIESLRAYKFAKIYEKFSHDAIPQANPVAIILGGQNASGKSTLSKQFLEEYRKNGAGIAKVEGDAFREYHPLFFNFIQDNDKLMAAYTAKDSARWTERLIRDLAESRCNMLIETTLRNPNVVVETVKQLHHTAGYNVLVKAFVVHYDKSLAGCFQRYEEMKATLGYGRFVHDHALNASYTGMPETLQALQKQNIVDSIHLYTREKSLFLGNYRTADIVDIVHQERRREFTPEEIKFLSTQWGEILTMMLARGAKKEEFSEISIRMRNRIQMMISGNYPQANINAMVNIYNVFEAY
ncbi:MAG: zeta toxin family protein [Prevotellaceae bacterium]|jgi:hypothetical protein|nr:zeta toxin family protein [Prevotellaceae bacterium]